MAMFWCQIYIALIHIEGCIPSNSRSKIISECETNYPVASDIVSKILKIKAHGCIVTLLSSPSRLILFKPL